MIFQSGIIIKTSLHLNELTIIKEFLQFFPQEAVSEYEPTSFLTIHSGTKGMYMPWAYDMEHLAKKNGAAMIQMLKARLNSVDQSSVVILAMESFRKSL